MDEFRYALGVILVVIMPVVITFWLVIHGGSQFWPKQNPRLAYGVAGFALIAVGTLAYLYHNALLLNDLGMSWPLFVAGAAIYLASWALWRPVKRHLDFRTFAGVPEVTREKIELIQDGPFAIVRHPRYLMVAIGIFGWCLMSNYAGGYLMGLASVLGLVLVVRLEERDLLERFGDDYRTYQARVPQLVPSPSGVKRFFRENF